MKPPDAIDRGVRLVRLACLGAAGAGAAGILLMAASRTRTPELPPVQACPGQMCVEGLTTALVQPDGTEIRVSAGRVETAPARLIGPFGLGFLRGVTAEDVRIDVTLGDGDDAAETSASLPAALADGLGSPTRAVAGLEIRGFAANVQRRDGERTTLRAEICTVQPRSGLLECWKGQLDEGGESTVFGRALYDIDD